MQLRETCIYESCKFSNVPLHIVQVDFYVVDIRYAHLRWLFLGLYRLQEADVERITKRIAFYKKCNCISAQNAADNKNNSLWRKAFRNMKTILVCLFWKVTNRQTAALDIKHWFIEQTFFLKFYVLERLFFILTKKMKVTNYTIIYYSEWVTNAKMVQIKAI